MSIASVSGRLRAERKAASMAPNREPYRVTYLSDGTWLVIRRATEEVIAETATWQEAKKFIQEIEA